MTHDFKDGLGEVPAHQHPQGGGWVADTARVDITAYIGPYAKVFGNATIRGHAQVYDDAQISGTAWIRDSARVYGQARVSGGVGVYGHAEIYGDTVLGDAFTTVNVHISSADAWAMAQLAATEL